MKSVIQIPLLLVIILVSYVNGQNLPRPTRIRVTSRTKSELEIEWRNPKSVTYDEFKVSIAPAGIVIVPNKPGDKMRKFRQLEAGNRYTVYIQGWTAQGESSNVLEYEVWTEPEEPSGITIVPIQEISISISIMGIKTAFTALVDGMQVEWDRKTNEQEYDYDLELYPRDGVELDDEDDGSISGRMKKIVTGLTPGKEYTVYLRSKVGPEYDAVLSSPVTRKMRMPPAIPYLVEVVDTKETNVSVKTHGPIEGIHDDLDFELYPKHGLIGESETHPNYPMFDLHGITNLRSGTSYNLKVYSVSKGVRGMKPYNITFTTKPSAPLNIRIADYDSNSVTLQWKQAHKFSTSDEVTYFIQFSDLAGNHTQSATVKNLKHDSTVKVQVHKLIPGTTYNFKVSTILNGLKSSAPAQLLQTTIPKKPSIQSFVMGDEKGVNITFGNPKEGKCPSVKVFYSPHTNGTVNPEYHKLGEVVGIGEIPTNGRYTVHVRCESGNVEGPELVISALNEKSSTLGKNDLPKKTKTRLPCMPAPTGNSSPNPENIAPDACCNNRPYQTAEKECCGNSLLDKDGSRMCCNSVAYFKRSHACCPGHTIKSLFDGCDEA